MKGNALILLVLLIPCVASAELYRWTDKNGAVHLSTTPPPPNSAKEMRAHEEEDDLLNSGLVFLNKLYTRESYREEKEKLKGQIRYFQEKCRIDAEQWESRPKDADAYCESNAGRNQRALDVLTSDPDRYFYVTSGKTKSYGTGETPLYQPWE